MTRRSTSITIANSTHDWSSGRSLPRQAAPRPQRSCRGPGQTGVASARWAARVASTSGKPPDGWPGIARLIDLAFHDDADVAGLACKELLARLPTLPVIPLGLDDGRRKVIRREASP
jgi:hypothetical protein